MKQEDKKLLYIDLCARLPYNVIVHIHDLDVIDYDNYLYVETLAKFESNDVTLKPYLRPLSSMTEDEREYFEGLSDMKCTLGYAMVKVNFCLKRHLDINGLIPKGLAIEVTEENNPYNRENSVK